jgi:hypothetical protein
MQRPDPLWLLALISLAGLAAAVRPASAYSDYDQGCKGCHDFFTGQPDLHDLHRNRILQSADADRCQLCHTQSRGNEGAPVLTYRSRGGLPAPGPSNFGCAGCHGNDYGDLSTSDGLPKATAKGLRLHHQRAGITVCATCHAAGDAGLWVGEEVPPPYYQRSDVLARDPCDAAREGTFIAPLTRGLDNDGDGAYDAADPDCAVCAVLPGVIQRLRAVKDPGRTDAVFDWQLDPASAGYRVYSLSQKLEMAPPPVGSGPPRGSHPAATLRCSAPDGTTTTCTHSGACDPAVGASLYYQTVGVCAGGTAEEGPN